MIMRKTLGILLVALAMPSISFGQSNSTFIEIDRDFRSTISDTSRMKKRTVVNVGKQGEIDSIRLYLLGKDIKFVYHKTFTSAYSYGEGPPVADLHTIRQLLIKNNKIKYINVVNISESYRNNRKNGKATADEESAYFSDEGKCLRYIGLKTVEGDFITIINSLKKTENILDDCMYCPYNSELVKKYLQFMELSK